MTDTESPWDELRGLIDVAQELEDDPSYQPTSSRSQYLLRYRYSQLAGLERAVRDEVDRVVVALREQHGESLSELARVAVADNLTPRGMHFGGRGGYAPAGTWQAQRSRYHAALKRQRHPDDELARHRERKRERMEYGRQSDGER